MKVSTLSLVSTAFAVCKLTFVGLAKPDPNATAKVEVYRFTFSGRYDIRAIPPTYIDEFRYSASRLRSLFI